MAPDPPGGARPRRAPGAGSGAGRAPPSSLAEIRRRRESQGGLSLQSSAGVLGGGALAAAAAAAALLLLRGSAGDPEAEQRRLEALRVLRNDGLEATDHNVDAAVRLVEAATRPYDDSGFRLIDPRVWPPSCSSASGACEPDQLEAPVARQLPGGSSVSLLGLARGEAKVWLVEGLLPAAEAAELLGRASRLNFTGSPTNHPQGQEWRSSSTAFLPRDDPDLAPLLQRAAALCGVPADFLEAPQVVRYLPGERYQPHLDSEGAHHRHWTLLLYLNDPLSGGATAFPLLGLKVLPAPRVALLWENLRAEPTLPQKVRDYRTLHDGQAPSGAEAKYALNIWVRGAPFAPPEDAQR